MSVPRRVFPLVISAPSGAGKTTIARALVARHDDLVFSVSATSRQPRAGEVQHRDYHFVDDAGFDRLVEHGDLVEWAVVHGCRYGTLLAELEDALGLGRVVVLDIDVQGARQIRRARPDSVGVFVLPPSADELFHHLSRRGSEGDAERTRRLRTAREELRAVDVFDYVVVNDELDAAVARLEAIVVAERHRTEPLLDADDGLKQKIERLDSDLAAFLERSG